MKPKHQNITELESQPNRRIFTIKTPLSGMLVTLFLLVTSMAIRVTAETYYVASEGSDVNPGSLLSPFKTISKAAGLMQAGDTCYIRNGMYFETVRPANSGIAGSLISFKNYNGENVVVSAADKVEQWTLESGSVYSAAVNWTMGPGFDQVIAGEDLMIEAREPNIDTKENLIEVAAGGNSFGCTAYADRVESASLNQANDYWKGGIFWGKCGNAWSAQSAYITSSSAGKIFVSNKTVKWWWHVGGPGSLGDKDGAGEGFITGCRNALNIEREWFMDSAAQRLYLWAPAGQNPDGLNIYVKKRNTVFDLSNRSYVHIEGINGMAGGVDMDDANGCALRRVNLRYACHFFAFENGRGDTSFGSDVNDPRASGICISGQSNTVQDCRIEYTAGAAIRLDGRNHTVMNSVIHDSGYAGTYASGIFIACFDPAGGIGGHTIHGNSIFRSGRSAINWTSVDVTGSEPPTVYAASFVNYNEVYDYMYLCDDGGGIYNYNVNGSGTKVAYNWIHDDKSSNPANAGIYIDNAGMNFKIHHNVVWNSSLGVRLNLPATNHEVINNTFWVSTNAMDTWQQSGVVMTNCRTENNLSNLGNFQGNTINKNLQTSDAMFQGSGGGGLVYRINSNSPAVDYGNVRMGITDGFVGAAPDAGAYEFGGGYAVSNWQAGTSLQCASPILSPEAGDFTTTQTVVMTSTTSGVGIRYTTDGSTPTTTYGTLYSGAVNVDASITMKVIGHTSGLASSAVVTHVYTINSPFSNWSLEYFGSQANDPLVAGEGADPNGNGIPNLLEYALGGDPLGNISGISLMPYIGISAANRLTFTFQRNADLTDINYIVEATTDLTGPWTPIASSTAGAVCINLGGASNVTESGDSLKVVTVEDMLEISMNPTRFIRLKISK